MSLISAMVAGVMGRSSMLVQLRHDSIPPPGLRSLEAMHGEGEWSRFVGVVCIEFVNCLKFVDFRNGFPGKYIIAVLLD
jgi:hypothetical protein